MSRITSSPPGNGKAAAPDDGAGGPDLRRLVRGRYVVHTGNLAWVTREQLADVVESFGGHHTNNLGAGVAVLVIGERDLPLNHDGTLSQHLRLARAMERGRTLGALILSERRFLEGLGLERLTGAGEGDEGPRLYTTATLTDMLEIPPARIRAWVAAGLVRPAKTVHGVWHFDFRQVAAVKTLDRLIRSGVKPGRLRRSLGQLRNWLPQAEQSLEQLALLERDGELLVRLEQGGLSALDGQLQLDFSGGGNAAEAVAPLRLYAGPSTAAQWFEQGVEQQRAGYLAEAAESYRQALQVGGPAARVCFDLANVLRELGQRREAIERYLQAVEIDKDFGDAWNNLGIVLCDLGRKEAACTAFRRAIAADSGDARAYYNLADVLDELGLRAEAAEYWRHYLLHDSGSPWSQYARERLALL